MSKKKGADRSVQFDDLVLWANAVLKDAIKGRYDDPVRPLPHSVETAKFVLHLWTLA